MAGKLKDQRATEDYLKTIYYLAEKEEPVSTSRIAKARDTRPASVTKMVQRLDRAGLVSYQKHRGVSLTDSGMQIALSTLRHHRLTELFLAEVLGLSWDEVHEHAEILEHAIDDRLEERMDAVLGFPKFDPHGDPIPSRDGAIAEINARPLTSLPVGCEAKVARIVDDTDGELLCYLEGLGLVPGIEIEIKEIEPFDGPITLQIDGERRIVGHKVATIILMTPCSELNEQS
ncbi:MAG TPA: metal-dependent transcriptional regulator [candidate division Zixibacteria bacterium]|nr:metal-dependent transcriptional regulator [candidate division Zixibacteria bacterium]